MESDAVRGHVGNGWIWDVSTCLPGLCNGRVGGRTAPGRSNKGEDKSHPVRRATTLWSMFRNKGARTTAAPISREAQFNASIQPLHYLPPGASSEVLPASQVNIQSSPRKQILHPHPASPSHDTKDSIRAQPPASTLRLRKERNWMPTYHPRSVKTRSPISTNRTLL